MPLKEGPFVLQDSTQNRVTNQTKPNLIASIPPVLLLTDPQLHSLYEAYTEHQLSRGQFFLSPGGFWAYYHIVVVDPDTLFQLLDTTDDPVIHST